MNQQLRARTVLRPFLNAVMPARPLTVKVLSGPARGLRIVIDPQREKTYWAGTHERVVQSVLCGLLRPGMTVWDIGAHAGFFTAVCSRQVGPNGEVHSFEPAPETRARLGETVRLNALGNVHVHPYAVGAERSEGVLYGVGRSAQATLRPIGARARSASPVEVRTLSDLWEELGPPDVIKVDAEGAEVGIVEGGLAVLEQAAASLVVEIHGDGAAARIAELLPGHEQDRIDDGHVLIRPGGKVSPST